MRYNRLMMLFALAGGLAFASACGGDDKDTDTDAATPGDDDDDDDDVTIDSTPVGGTYDTAYLLFAFAGGGTVSAGNYSGVELITLEVAPFSAAPYSLCDWTWDAAGPVPSAVAAAPCTDDVGNACTFTLDATLTNGAETAGDCVSVFGYTLGVDGGTYTYGHADNYGAYGPALMYYSTTGYYWFRGGYSEYDPASGAWSYLWPLGLYYYYIY